MNATPLFVLDAIHAGYLGQPVLRGLSATIGPAEIVALIGPNGVGKTTLLKVLAGDLPLQAGQLTYRGKPLAAWPRGIRAQSIAYVPPVLDLLTAMPVAEFVALGRTPYLLGGRRWQKADQAAVEHSLQVMALDRFRDRNVHELSEGEKHRAMMALALAQEPTVLLLDEPTAHLDIKHAWHTMEWVASWHREMRTTVIMTTHDLNLAATFAERLWLLADGTLRAAGPAAEVLTPDLLSHVYDYPIRVWTDAGATTRRVFPVRVKDRGQGRTSLLV